MTKPLKPRPVVRVVIDWPSRVSDASGLSGIRDVVNDFLGDAYDRSLDYRRPRVVSVRRKGGRK